MELSRAGATPETLVVPAVTAVMLLVLRFEEERWRRAEVGTTESPTEVEEAFDTTDAVCCRSRESSRVSLLT